MNCKKCNAELQEGDIFCPNCLDRFAVAEQKAKVDEVAKNAKNTILNQLHSIIFLIMAIAFTAATIPVLISIFSGLPGSLFSVTTIELIFMILTAVGLWMGYFAKEESDLNKILRRSSLYDAYTRVMYTISIVLLAIAGVLLTILAFAGGSCLSGLISGASGSSTSQAEKDAVKGGIVFALIIVVVFAISIAIISLIRSIFKNRRKYFISLADSVTTGKYEVTNAPIIGSFVIGGYYVLSIIPTIVIVSLRSKLVDPFIAEMGEAGGLFKGLLDGMMSGMISAAIGSLVVGAYFILSGIWIKTTHDAQLKNNAILSAEQQKLSQLTSDTNDAINEIEMRKRRIANEQEIEKRRIAAEEKEKAELEAKQTQAMMQQMMMQMMMQQQANNAQNQPVAPATPVAPEAPVAPSSEEDNTNK